jgi:hypothetical protein
VTAKERRSRFGDVLLDVPDIIKKAICIYLISLTNNCALLLPSGHTSCNPINEGTVTEDLSLCGFSPLSTKKINSRVTMNIHKWNICHMQFFQ